MRSSHLLDPDLRPVFENFPQLNLTEETLAEQRALTADLAVQLFGADPLGLDGLKRTERDIAGAAGDPDVRIVILEPDDSVARTGLRPGILETHGGGHVMGSADVSAMMYANIVRALGAVMVLVDYRLSPETKFPGPLDDCYAALKWMVANCDALDIDPERIAVVGGSAGATLAAGVALLARDRDQIPIAHLHLTQPMLDDRTCVDPDPSPFVGEFCWTRESNNFGWASRLDAAPGSEGVSPYAAPGRMEDLSAMPPTFISCGALDLFVEESIEFARKLLRAGVPVELHIYPGAPHGAPLGTTGPRRDPL